MEEKYQKIKEIVEKELSCSAHNMEHVMRVYNRRREPRVYPWVNPSKIFDEVARRFGGNLRF